MLKKSKKKLTTNNSETLWFKRKLYGWGWTPCTWQGWLVILVWAVFFIISTALFDHEWLKNIFVMIVSTAALIWICFKKGEKPRWQWGKR